MHDEMPVIPYHLFPCFTLPQIQKRIKRGLFPGDTLPLLGKSALRLPIHIQHLVL